MIAGPAGHQLDEEIEVAKMLLCNLLSDKSEKKNYLCIVGKHSAKS